MSVFKAVMLSGVVILAGGATAQASSELSGLDAAQKQIVVQDGPKDGGAIVVRTETEVPAPEVMVSPEVQLEDSIIEDRITDEESTDAFDSIQERLQGAIETPVPDVQPTQPTVMPEAEVIITE